MCGCYLSDRCSEGSGKIRASRVHAGGPVGGERRRRFPDGDAEDGKPLRLRALEDEARDVLDRRVVLADEHRFAERSERFQ